MLALEGVAAPGAFGGAIAHVEEKARKRAADSRRNIESRHLRWWMVSPSSLKHQKRNGLHQRFIVLTSAHRGAASHRRIARISASLHRSIAAHLGSGGSGLGGAAWRAAASYRHGA